MPNLPLPITEATLKGPIAAEIVSIWTQLAIEFSATGGYVRGLHAAESIIRDYDGDPFTLVVQNVAPYASYVDEGHAAFSLPQHIRRWKLTKNGKRIIVVPFRHFTEHDAPTGRAARAVMPDAVHQLAKALAGRPIKGAGDLYKQSKSYVYYRAQGWPEVPAGKGYTWKKSPYEGLRARGGATPGGGTQNTFGTFRVITPDSPGWMIPPLEGKHFPTRVIEMAGPHLAQMVGEAISSDLGALFTAQMNAAGVISVFRA